jgi:nicotinate-nucleotide adenylyltransferase
VALTTRQRVGILGGTFDPVHNGHLAVADLALERLKLDRILFIPAARPPHKHSGAITPFPVRSALLEQALAGNSSFELCTIEKNRPGPSFSVDTLRELRGSMADADFFFIIGLDAFAEINTWKEWQKIPELAALVVINRLARQVGDVSVLVSRLFPGWRQAERGMWTAGDYENIYFIEMQPLDVSSTGIREKLRQGRSIKGLTPVAVREYIKRYRLYR